jgi:hypothetical protein
VRTVVSSSSELSRALSSPDAIAHWIGMVRGTYLEIPGLHLTRSQVQRLWGLDTLSCDRVLDALIAFRFLERTPDGAFVRAVAHH